MNRTQVRHALENVTNASVLLVCLVVLIVLVRGPISKTPRSAQPTAEELEEGAVFPKASELHLDTNKGTLVLALSTTCKFCAASVPFYQHLLQSANNTLALPILAVFPNSESDVTDFAKKVGTNLSAASGQDFRSLHIFGTPTIALVDSSGKVRKIWKGMLSEDQEHEILKVVQSGKI
jgi:thioredoxin-related protein